jgi:hypothetical protein
MDTTSPAMAKCTCTGTCTCDAKAAPVQIKEPPLQAIYHKYCPCGTSCRCAGKQCNC